MSVICLKEWNVRTSVWTMKGRSHATAVILVTYYHGIELHVRVYLIFIVKDIFLSYQHRIGSIKVDFFASSTVDCWFDSCSSKTKNYKIGMCCFSSKHASLRRMSKAWLARNQDNVIEWIDMSTRGLLVLVS